MDLKFIFVSMLYCLLLYFLYPVFHEQGLFLAFRSEPHDFMHVFFVFACSLFLAIYASFLRFGIYYIFNCFLVFTTFFPFLVLMPYFDSGYVFSGVPFFAVLASFLVTTLGLLFGNDKCLVFRCNLNSKYYVVALFFVNLLSICVIVFSFRGIISFSAFHDIYAHRALYREAVGVSSYFVHWHMMVFAPLILVYGLARKSCFMILIAISGFLVVFLITAFKVALAIPVLILLGFLTIRLWRSRLSGFSLALLFAYVLFFSFVFDLIFDVKYFSALFVDRIIYAHGVADLMIIEVFRDLPKAFWSNSFLRYWVESRYDVDPFIVVGQEYFGRDVRLNTNFFGDGFINAGLIGVVVSSLVASLVVLVSQMILQGKKWEYAILIFLPHLMAILNGPIQVSLLTNGLFILWCMLLISPRDISAFHHAQRV